MVHQQLHLVREARQRNLVSGHGHHVPPPGSVGAERGSEAPPRPVQAGEDAALGHAEHGRHRGGRDAGNPRQAGGAALQVGQSGDMREDAVRGLHIRRRAVGHRLTDARQALQVRQVPQASARCAITLPRRDQRPQPIQGNVQRQCPEPGIERLRAPKPVQLAVGTQQGVLQGVLRLLPVAEHRRQKQQQPVPAGRHQDLKGTMVALAGQQDLGALSLGRRQRLGTSSVAWTKPSRD